MNYTFAKIDSQHPVFSSADYQSDRDVFSYIENARLRDTTELYSDGRNAVVCRKQDHSNIWIWTKDDAQDDLDLLIALSKAVRQLNIDSPQFFIKPSVAQKFSDFYALISSDLSYQVYNEFSLGAYSFRRVVQSRCDDVAAVCYSEKYEDKLLEFYNSLKGEFGWSNEALKKIMDKYQSMDTFLLLKGGRIVSTAVIGNKEGSFASVRSVATIPSERKNGYGSCIVSFAAENVSKEGKRVMLYSNKANIAAAAMWINAGFEYLGDIHLIKS